MNPEQEVGRVAPRAPLQAPFPSIPGSTESRPYLMGATFSRSLWLLLGTILTLLTGPLTSSAVTPPTIRSTAYNGAYSNIVFYPVQPWMNTNTTLLTVEAWIRCNDLNGFQAMVSRHFTTNLWFGLTGNRLRFYRSGGTFADSDGTLVVGRWTHVAVTYDGATARFFIDGTAAGTKALANGGNNCTNTLSLGGQHDVLSSGDSFAAGYAFNGFLDEVRLWSVVRSQSAIIANMNAELRSGTGLLASFGSGGGFNDIRGSAGQTGGIPAGERLSGHGILPATLCIPSTTAGLKVDANIDLLNEYRGAETLVLRSKISTTEPDRVAYLMVSMNATNSHLYVGVPDLIQAGSPQIPVVQIMADVNVTNGASTALGDWQCSVAQDALQGGQIYTTNPPFFPTPAWTGWGQSVSNWQAVTGGSFEFHQSYEFRIHARHLNYFTNDIGLFVRYFDYSASGDELVGPRAAVPEQPATYAHVDWCGRADTDLAYVSSTGSITNLSGNVGVPGLIVSMYSGDSELTGTFLASTPTDAQGRFVFSAVPAPSERRITVIYSPPSSIVSLDPAIDSTFSSRVPVINTPYSVTFPTCSSSCANARVNFRYRQLGPVQVTGVTPSEVPAPVVVRTSPLKTTATAALTVTGTNFHAGVNVFFKGPGCALIPPNLCSSDWEEANITARSVDGTSLTADVPSRLAGVATSARGFQIVLENPSFPSTGGERWIYGPSVTVTPPIWPKLYGFEFFNQDDGPSWEEFEASYGDSIFATVPFTDIPLPGVRDPYYGIFFLVYMGWMDAAHGSCSGFASTSRMMAEGHLPIGAFDRPDSGEGVHGVLFPNGYVGRPPCDTSGDPCAPKPGRYTGFDLFHPFQPINIWSRITSLQGAQTSAEFLNTWLPQLHRPIPTGARRGISVGDPMLVLTRIRSDIRNNLIILSGREFQALHCVTPYGVVEEQGLMSDLVTPEPRAGFTLIKIYDSNWPGHERFIEVNRAQNTFRYQIGGSLIVEGPGLYYMPTSVFRGRRHALGPVDIAANLEHFLRVLHTGTTLSSFTDGAGGTAGWNGTNLVNSYDGALPMIPPGFVLGETERFDRTMFLLPDTNAPSRAWFQSAGSNVFLHYALGGGDIAFGFNAANAGVSNSVDGILIGLNQGLRAVGLRAGAPVTSFGAIAASRDKNGQSRVLLLDAGNGALTPDLQIERDEFKSVTIRNRSAAPLAFRLNLAGNDVRTGVFEQAFDLYTQPGQSTLTLRLPENPALASLTRELDTNNDGVPELIEEAPANGRLRISKEAGLLALRWREAGFGETLEATKQLAPSEWGALNATVSVEGADKVARLPSSSPASFFRLRLSGTNCLSFAGFPLGPRPNPWETNRFKFEARSAAGTLLAQNTIASRGGFTGLDVTHTLRILPSDDCHTLHVDIFQTSGFVTVEAVGALGTVVARQTLTDTGSGPQRVSLRGFRGLIREVRVVSPNALCLILNICAERTPAMNTATPLVTTCVSFSNVASGQFASPYAIDEVTVTATPGPITISTVSGQAGGWLKVKGQVQLDWKEAGDSARFRLWDFEGVITATAYDAGGAIIATAGPLPGSASPQNLAISAPGMTHVVLSSVSDKAFLQEICCSRRGN